MIPNASSEVQGETRLAPSLGRGGDPGWADRVGRPRVRLESAIVNDPPPWIPAGQSTDADPTRSVSTTIGDRFGPGSSRTDGFTPFVTSRAATAGPPGQAGPGVAESGPSAGTSKVRAENAGATTSARFLDEPGGNPPGGMVALAGAAGPGGPGGGGGDPEPPGGTEPEQPTVRIASPGKHDDDQGDPPQVLQGSSYKAAYVVTGSAATVAGADVQWVAERTTWAYPPKVAKGYGTFATVQPTDPNGDPDGAYTQFTAQPSSAPNTKVEWKDFTLDDMDYDTTQKKDGVVVDHFIDTFYWGPENEGIETVSVSVKFRKYVNGQKTDDTCEKGDSVKLDVLKPTGSIVKLYAGMAGVSAPINGTQYLEDDYRFRDDLRQLPPGTTLTPQVIINQVQHVGIKWQADVQLPNNITTGQFTVVQLVNSDLTFTVKKKPSGVLNSTSYKLQKLDADGLPVTDADGKPVTEPARTVLDHSFPYCDGEVAYRQSAGPEQVPTATAPIGWTLYGFDNPVIDLIKEADADSPISVNRRDDFTMTLVYTPATTTSGQIADLHAIWVPVARLSWSWFADANYTAGANPPWALDVTHGQAAQDNSVAAQTNGDFPSWKRNLSECGWYDNA